MLRNLAPFAQFKKRENHPWRSVSFSKVRVKSNTPPWVFFMLFNLNKRYQIAQNMTYHQLILPSCNWVSWIRTQNHGAISESIRIKIKRIEINGL